ncbi:MAG: asparagine synthase (glutamine-hydrolyzing) [Deltaproteobacteria bacterium]|nr:asparagine synthase (glutamine-hydrolyzing) [Deltaproteobacteria bacterium]MBK8235117.1 asparagine synthase (glutamine-hydrolyzing) [Deltaproteobacteria bacterium]MBK8716569.1 asparagine synthase (glutamine-hydrolyzing) [Deltaproteobacteria bacterium]MBP7289481.1 asparagine synthase (glutamine-hydrolyzing) [Nannocystaceae bacterium]
MCGITGMIRTGGSVDAALLDRMTDSLAHRGPDGRGVHIGDGFGFGHRRLAIIDLSTGAQPMHSADGMLCITFNGEIYNYIELRAQLIRAGHRFETHSDTEVLLAAYREWGDEMFGHLDGMFAFGLWDAGRRRLLCARDHLGVKPLYYAEQRSPLEGDTPLSFASEPKALLQCPWVSRELDPVALDAYMDLFYVPPPLSMFRGVRQLPPGSALSWCDGKLAIWRYWDAPPTIDERHDLETWAEIVEPVLRDAIVIQTRSDVPLGAFLSGGLDSSTITAVLAEHGSAPVSTFCVGYGDEGKSYDEREMARVVARHFGTDHHEVVLDIDVLQGLEAMVRGFDEPFGSPTALLSSALSKFTRGSVTVALAGDGGDELFGGYPRYRGMMLSERVSGLPEGVYNAGERLAQGREAAVARSYRRWARQFFAGAALPPAERYARWVGYTSVAERDGMYTPAFRERIVSAGRVDPVAACFAGPAHGDAVERAAYADLHGFLPENVLRGSDRMSMAWGLELRVPLCDVRLVELAMQIPSRHRVGALASKRVLRRIAENLLPKQILERKKLGFNAPLGVWLRRDLDRLVSQWLAPELVRARGWFDADAVTRIVHEHREGLRDHGLRLWSLIAIEQWHRCYGEA